MHSAFVMVLGMLLRADPEPPTALPQWVKALTAHAAVDIYAAHNFNTPADHASFLPGTGTSAKRADEVSLNLVSLEVALDPQPVGFHVWLGAGTAIEVLHAGEPLGVNVGPEVWKYVQQATVAARAPVGRGLLIEAGIYPSHIGLETLSSQANWNYTRSWMGEFSPYYETGVKATYSFTDHFAAQLHLLNGWQLISDNNHSAAVGTQLAWTDERWSVALANFAGPELANDDAHWRFFADLVLQLKVAQWLKLAVCGDVGLQQLPGAQSAIWHTVAGYVRFQISSRLAAALRAEYFSDLQDVISGARQTLIEGTATLELTPWPYLTLKLEGRYDHSTSDVFSSSRQPRNEQLLVLLGAVAAY